MGVKPLQAASEPDDIDTEATIWTVLGLAKKPSYRQPGPQTGSTVSPILWQAALDTLNFVKFASEDPLAGSLVTEWYSPPDKPNERMRINVFILSRALRSDSLSVTVDRQERSATGQWADTTIARKVEDDLETTFCTGRASSNAPGRRRRAETARAGRRSRRRNLKDTMSRYNFRETEAKWQRLWREQRLFEVAAEPGRPKYYVLEMFPYPSGKLHVGHVRNYTMGDLVARYRRARGFNVLHPMGWDAFGLPAENAAIAESTHPAVWTQANIATMRAQLQRMGFAYDWSREIATCHPEYYRHEQKMFLDFLAAGLAYRKESWVNWDPVENTVLANEQVIDGRGWRSGAVVEKRLLSQWFLRITAFTEELLDALGGLERWPERVRLMQENWIGRSEGARAVFDIDGRDERIEVFTTRPDTLFGASFLALSPNHPLAQRLAETDSGLAAFIAECNRMGTSEAIIEAAEKRGWPTGLDAVHPFDPSPTHPGLRRQFRADGIRHRGDLRLSRA